MKRTLCTLAALVLASGISHSALAAPPIELELAVEDGFSITGRQQWLRFLSDLGIENIRIRSGRAGERAEIIKSGTKSRPRYKVIGLLMADNKLVLKGASFSRGDGARLQAYLENLQMEGTRGVTEKKGSFGLTARELIALSKDLETPVGFPTKDTSPRHFITQIAKGIETPLQVDPQVRAQLLSAEASLVEVQGISSGTALAALLRPYGMILRPLRLSGGKVVLVVTSSKLANEPWPIGWTLERKDRDLLPQLYEFITVEIEDIEARKAIGAVTERLGAPVLYDHNNMLRHEIDLGKEVSFPAGRSYYKRILERLLYQVFLKPEVRMDEAGKAIIWITTIKQ